MGGVGSAQDARAATGMLLARIHPVAGKAPTVFPVTQRQAHVLREEWRGLASDGRDVLSMEDLTGESALELDDPFHASSLFLRGSPRRQIDTQVGAQPLRYAVHPQLS